MATMTKNIARLVNDLIARDYDAVQACIAAVDMVRDAGDRQRLEQLAAAHRRHIDELTAIVRLYGLRPAEHADVRALAESGRVLLGGIFSDRALLDALRVNERETEAAYGEAVAHEGVPQDVRMALMRILREESLHHTWLVRRVDQLASEG